MGSLEAYVPPILMVSMWLILLVAIYASLEHSAFRGASRAVIALCASSIAALGGYHLYLHAVVPAYVSMGLAILLGIALIIKKGFNKLKGGE